MSTVSPKLPRKLESTRFSFRLRKLASKHLLVAAVAALSVAGLAAVSLYTAPAAIAYPKPSPYPISWQLKFDHSIPKRIAVTAPGESSPKAYWYMTFTVANNTDSARQFLPDFEMVTGEGKVIRSNTDVSDAVFDAIKRRENDSQLETLSKVTGRLLVGDDEARESVAIWAEPNPKMGKFSIYVAGLSGETVMVKDGEVVSTDDWTKMTPEERAKITLLQKTLELNYEVVGDANYPQDNITKDLGQEWVMR